jgi:hypothetical protein
MNVNVGMARFLAVPLALIVLLGGIMWAILP